MNEEPLPVDLPQRGPEPWMDDIPPDWCGPERSWQRQGLWIIGVDPDGEDGIVVDAPLPGLLQ